MARSYLHTPITGITTCKSEKLYKRFANRRFRRRVNQLVRTHEDPYRHLCSDILREIPTWEEPELRAWANEPGMHLRLMQDHDWQDNAPNIHWEYPLLRELSNVWAFGKDGKVWWGDLFDTYQGRRK